MVNLGSIFFDASQETHTQIRKWLAENISPQVAQQMRIMYGGQVLT